MTYLLDEHRLGYIHIPKTGGHTVWHTLEANGAYRAKDRHGARFTHHQTMAAVRSRFGNAEFDQWQWIVTVRNPFERALSLYYGRKKITKHSVEGFQKYMRRWRGLAKYRWNPYYPQSRFIVPGENVHVFKLEEIDRLYDWLEDRYGLTTFRDTHWKTGAYRMKERLPLARYYTSEIISEMTGKHVADLARWGYSYG
jgi:hypothetical protein